MYIYKIHKENDPNCYVGSTVNLKNRMRSHKSDCYNEKGERHNLLLYKYIRENGGWSEWIVSVLECIEDCDRFKLFELEQKWIDEIKPSLNCCKAPTGFSKEEYDKQYREKNKEHIKEQSKQYKEKNKEHIKEQKKQYREHNKEHINQKHNCACGGKYTSSHKSHHFKTKKHQDYINQNK